MRRLRSETFASQMLVVPDTLSPITDLLQKQSSKKGWRGDEDVPKIKQSMATGKGLRTVDRNVETFIWHFDRFPLGMHGPVVGCVSYYSTGPGSISGSGTCLLPEPDAPRMCLDSFARCRRPSEGILFEQGSGDQLDVGYTHGNYIWDTYMQNLYIGCIEPRTGNI